MPTKAELDNRIFQACERSNKGQPLEDDYVELKAQWMPPNEYFARILAAACNGAQGEDVLWIMGVDENEGVVGVANTDPAQWLDQLKSHFSGDAPTLAQSSIVHASTRAGEEEVVYGLLFDTKATPYLVIRKLLPTGVTSEVPWREGTAARPAKRADFLRMLVPRSREPIVKILYAELVAHPHNPASFSRNPVGHWELLAEIYVQPRTRDPVHFPKHLLAGNFGLLVETHKFTFDSFAFPDQPAGNVDTLGGAITFERPGLVRIAARCQAPSHQYGARLSLELTVEFGRYEDPAAKATAVLLFREAQQGVQRWCFDQKEYLAPNVTQSAGETWQETFPSRQGKTLEWKRRQKVK